MKRDNIIVDKTKLYYLADGEEACKIYTPALVSDIDCNLVPLEDYNTIVALFNICMEGIDEGDLRDFHSAVIKTPMRFF